MASELTILCLEEQTPEDINLIKLANFSGINCKVVYFSEKQNSIEDSLRNFKKNDLCLASDSKTLSVVFKQTQNIPDLKHFLLNKLSFLFIYNIEPGECSNHILPVITSHAVESVSNFKSNHYEYEVHKNCNAITGELGGIKFGPINALTDFKFELIDNDKKIKKIITIGDKGFFISFEEQNCNIFLVSSSKIINIDQNITKGETLKEYFSQFVPHIMFLKHAFKKVCWHNDYIRANLIIDDPLLKRNYGFLNFEKLLKNMSEYKYATTIAFIPWNYRRTDKRIAELFKKENKKLSICIHGCNHTKAEFGAKEEKELEGKIQCSYDRMEAHKHLTGLDYSKIMVFPQGYFSLTAMRLLKKNNFFAAVNSSGNAVDSEKLKFVNILDVAIMCDENFPLFIRRYSTTNLVDFAIDAFLGKPILIAEHHSFFKNGYASAGECITQICSISEKIKWGSLDETLNTSYKKRIGDFGEIICTIYTKKVFIENTYSTSKKFTIQKNETLNIPIKWLLMNKKKINYQINNDMLEFSFVLKPKETAEVEIVYQNRENKVRYNQSFLKRFQIILRRLLSEYRDNYLSKNDFLMTFVNKIFKLKLQ